MYLMAIPMLFICVMMVGMSFFRLGYCVGYQASKDGKPHFFAVKNQDSLPPIEEVNHAG